MPPTLSWPLYSSPAIRVAVRVPFSPQLAASQYCHATFALHQHFYRGSVVIGKKQYDLLPGDLTITPPNTPSRYALEEQGYHWCIHFAAAQTVPGEKRTKLPMHLRPGTRAETASDRFRTIVDIVKRFAPGPTGAREQARAEASALLQAFLLKLPFFAAASGKRSYTRKSDTAIEAIRQHIDTNYQHPLTVANLARKSSLSRNYFATRFHEIFGVTVQQYLLDRRIELARNLLLSSNLPVKQIAYECGIHDPHYFNKQFRRRAGASPTAYRASGGNVW